MAFGVNGPCYNCVYLDWSEKSGSKVYCEWYKSYIHPDQEGCGHHKDR